MAKKENGLPGLPENWKPPGRRVLENQPGLNVINLGPGGEAVEREVAQMIGVAYRDMDQEIIAAGHVKNAPNLGQLDHVLAKCIDEIS